jgi:NTP pyrophosphatase (non-canonical NTP hydrolase)
MDFNDYQRRIQEFAKYPENGTGSKLAISYAALGLSGEAFELFEKLDCIVHLREQLVRKVGKIDELVKKHVRDSEDSISYERLDAIIKEGGDVLWYLARIFYELGVSFNEVPRQNIEKLSSRKQRGVLGGSGDNR